MDIKQLTSGRFTSPVSTGNQPSQPSLLPRDPHTPPYKSSETDKNREAEPNRLEPQEVYLPYGKQHAQKFGVKIALTLKLALEMRQAGQMVLTIREADIAARWKVPLDNDFMHKALKVMGGLLTEGIPGEKDNAFQLRETYNRGVVFKRDFYFKVDRERQIKVDQAMGEILVKLTNLDLPAWLEEVHNGFAVELCKPEYMNWEQYREAAKNCVFRDPDSFNTKENSHAEQAMERV